MPYIKAEKRAKLWFNDKENFLPKEPGELNYLLTEICNVYRKDKGLSYQTINDILGALEGAKLEFVRRVVNPYEDEKIKENGDIY